jgi:hypothetical protein
MNPFLNYIEALQGAHIEEQFFKFKYAFNKYNNIIILSSLIISLLFSYNTNINKKTVGIPTVYGEC